MSYEDHLEEKINDLQQENAALRYKLARIEEYGVPPLKTFHALEARIERLEGALQKIVKEAGNHGGEIEIAGLIARQALSDGEPFECNCEDLRSCRDLYGNKHGAVDELKKRKR